MKFRKGDKFRFFHTGSIIEITKGCSNRLNGTLVILYNGLEKIISVDFLCRQIEFNFVEKIKSNAERI